MTTELKEFDDLIAALTDERPQIDPGFARELDARAAAGFERPGRRWRFPFPKVSLMVGAPAVALSALVAGVVVLAMVSGGGGDGEEPTSAASSSGETAVLTEDSPASTTEQFKPPEPELDELAATGRAYGASTKSGVVRERSADAATSPLLRDARSAPGTAAVGQGRRGRLQELSATLTLVAPPGEVASVGDRILATTDEIGGFVVSSTVRSTDGTGGGGSFQLRIPTDRLDDGIARLSRIAHVRERSQGVLDITSERNVARERLEEGRAERVSLLQRLEEADTDFEVDALQAQIANLNDAIGRYRADLRRVVRRAQFAAVDVTLMAAGEDEVIVPDDGQWTPGDAIRDAGRVLEVIAGVLVIAAAVLVPLLLLGGAIAVTRRAAGRRGRERVLDAV